MTYIYIYIYYIYIYYIYTYIYIYIETPRSAWNGVFTLLSWFSKTGVDIFGKIAGRLCASNWANRYQEKMAAAKGVGNFERPSVKSRPGGG